MKCEVCQDREATIHLTQVVDGAVKKIHLCETCAAEKGFDIHGPMSITDILLGLGEEEAPTAKAVMSGEGACPHCHLRRADFKKTGRLGCPACYDSFHDELEPILKAIHRSEQHKGKVPVRERERVRHTVEVESLQQQLETAIAKEHFEEAAKLRDAIQDIRSSAGPKDTPS